jgi:2-oxo-3-hexenedioate decarboxylase
MTASLRDVDLWEVALTQARDRAELAARPGEGSSVSIADAYVLSRRMLDARARQGWRRVGRKIGFTNSEMMREYGIDTPIFGYMYDRTVTHCQVENAEISLVGLVQPRIEPEIVFRLAARPPVTRDPLALLGCVESMAVGFELVQCHFPDWAFTAAETVADGGLHGRLVTGPPMVIEPDGGEALVEALATFQVELALDGEVMARGGGARVLGSPLNALADLVELLRHLPDHPALEAGEVVTTGTLTLAMPVAANQRWSVRIEGLAVPPVALVLA